MADEVIVDKDFEEMLGVFQRLGGDIGPPLMGALLEAVSGMAQAAAIKRMTAANPPYLNVQTGQGRASVLASPRATGAPGIVTGLFGSNREYIRAHEMGVDAMVSVPPHSRRPSNRGRAVAMSTTSRQATRWAKKGQRGQTVSVIYVRGHARHVRLRARHFLLHSLQEGMPRVPRLLTSALRHYALTGEISDQAGLMSKVPR